MTAAGIGQPPLAGVLVADFSRVLAGPYATMTLGDLGATVVKVERPGTGDDTRTWSPPVAGDGLSTYFVAVNRNKRSVTLDLSSPRDAALARRLAERADVLVENFRPGTMERHGLGHEQLAETNPGLVFCSITGFGATDAARDLPGYDLLVQAVSGLMSITGHADGPPTKVGVALVDHICGLQATVGILAALAARRHDGRGRRVEVSLLGAALAALSNQGTTYVENGRVPVRLGNRHPSIVPYQTFRTADGHLALACGNDRQFAAACTVVGLPDIATDARFATNPDRVAHAETLVELLQDRLERRPTGEWVARFQDADVPAGPVNDIAQAFRYATDLGLDAVTTTDHDGTTQHTLRSPIRLSDTTPPDPLPAPHLGEHDATIRAWLTARQAADTTHPTEGRVNRPSAPAARSCRHGPCGG